MSIHVCKCTYNGQEEWHLRYPGLTEEQANELASRINAGHLDMSKKTIGLSDAIKIARGGEAPPPPFRGFA